MIAALRRERPVPDAIACAVRAPFEQHGGEWSTAPVLQPLTALLDLAGEALRARLFVVQDEGAEEWALRPDFTIALAREHIARAREAGTASGVAPARRLYEGEAFRTAPRGSPRASEFIQIGVESFGEAGDPALQDADIAALAWRAARGGGRADLALVLGDVALFADFLRAVGLPQTACLRLTRLFAGGRSVVPELARLTDGEVAPATGGRLSSLLADLPEGEAVAVLEELWRLAGIQPVGGRAPGEIVHRIAERAQAARGARLTQAEAGLVRAYLAVEGDPERALDQIQDLAHGAGGALDPPLEGWRLRLRRLADGDGPRGRALSFAAGFVRPFGYYDGVLFEVRSAALSPDEPVAAGGRYDGLLARLGGAAQASVGCMVRPARAWAGSAE